MPLKIIAVYILIINILFLLAIDILSFITLGKGHIIENKTGVRILKILHLLLSLCSWIILLLILIWKGDFADNRNIAKMLFMGFLIAAIWLPRIIIIIFSNLAFFLRRKFLSAARVINYIGIILSVATISLIAWGTFVGRFDFRFEEVNINYHNLPADLDGFKIVHLSDMHLSSFHRNKDRLEKLLTEINTLKPDIIVNTGDFVTIAWNEMAPFSEILNKSHSRYGNYAIPGNHDAGTYHPYYDEHHRELNVSIFDSLLTESGYLQLKDSCLILNINDSRLKIAGVITRGSIPDIIFGDLEKALGDQDADFTILLTHDPNHWYYELQESKKVNLTLSGHTHGMQFGLKIGNFQWSLASKLYPAWNGLYGANNNYLYVNRGLGTISLPSRIGMPPEITVITLRSDNQNRR